MTRLIAVALVVAGVALPVCAQRGGGHGGSGGHSSGFASHGGSFASYSGGFASRGTPVFRGSFNVPARTIYRPAPQLASRIAPRDTPGRDTPGFVQSPSALSFYRRPVDPVQNRPLRPNGPLYWRGAPYGVAVLPYPGYLGVPYDGFYHDSANISPAPAYYPDQGDYTQQLPQSGPAPNDYDSSAYGPLPPSPETASENAVTLVFKDGRPVEQIHNYILTRSTLYVRDEPHRDIPVDQLDLVATEKMNHNADVNFQLPTVVR